MKNRNKILIAIVGVIVGAAWWFVSSDDFLTDSSTRMAADIGDAARTLQGSSASTYTLIHRPKASPEGCTHDYKVQVSQQSIMVMWCKSASGDSIVASHGTTSHLNYVDVPETTIMEKRAGEPVTFELQKTGGKPSVVRVH